MKYDRQVVVTGLGTVNGLGNDCKIFWERLIEGATGVDEVIDFDSAAWRTHMGCEVKGTLPESGHPDRAYDILMSAVKEAVTQAGGDLSPERTGVVVGTLQAGMKSLEIDVRNQVRNGQPADVFPTYPTFVVSGLSRYVASSFGLHGPVITSNVACAASGAAISRAVDLIRLGYADAMITGGADAFYQGNFSGFNAIRSAAPTQCRPFSKSREGLIIGEGSGILILESYQSAIARGAKPLASVLGTGLAEDAYHITSPHPEGDGAARSMQAALDDAGFSPTDIDYINAHGTGTPQNDKMETKALKTIFGDRAKDIPVSSIKAAVGHCMGAAGGVEAVASILALMNSVLPPTLNFEPGDPDCDLDYVPNTAREKKIRTVLSNSFGFAGNDASVIFGLPPRAGNEDV